MMGTLSFLSVLLEITGKVEENGGRERGGNFSLHAEGVCGAGLAIQMGNRWGLEKGDGKRNKAGGVISSVQNVSEILGKLAT